MNFSEYSELRESVAIDAGELSYLDVGDGPPVVFVHGLFVSAYLWRHVIDQLKGERRCIGYNLPAHGHSRVSPDQDLSRTVTRIC